MKWAALICLVIFFISTESRHVHKRHHEHQPRCVNELVQLVGLPVIENLILVLVAQDFPKCSVDEHRQMQAKIIQLVENCVAHPEEPECKKHAMTLYHDAVCKEVDSDRYPWTTECCKKEDVERNKCFIDKRGAHIAPYKIPDIAEACKEYKEHPKYAYDYYISQIGARHQNLQPQTVLAFAKQYNLITSECCETEDKAKCFIERITQIKKLTNYVEGKHKQICHIIEEFPEKVLHAFILVKSSLKFPKMDFATAEKITQETVHHHQECCRGDAVECMVESMEVTDHVCKEKAHISTNLDDCCAKGLMERTPCIAAMPNEEVDLSIDLKPYHEGDHVCENYANDKTKHLAHFSYDYARSHQDSAALSCLRVSEGYEGLLEKCCASENHAECLKQATALLEAALKTNEELVKQNCEGLSKLGLKDFNILLLTRYNAKMPKVTPETIVEIANKMTKIGVYCCALGEKKIAACAEEKLDVLLGDMCARQKETFISDKVRDCCKDSYYNRRPCFTNLGPDANYVAEAWDVNKLPFDSKLCEGTEEEQITKKQVLLAQYLKMKPHCGSEKLKEVVGSFRSATEKCCSAADRQICFTNEKAALQLQVLAH